MRKFNMLQKPISFEFNSIPSHYYWYLRINRLLGFQKIHIFSIIFQFKNQTIVLQRFTLKT